MPDSKDVQMQEYAYTGPTSGMTLRVGDREARSSMETMLFSGTTVTLPPDHPHVQCLIAQGFLAAVEVSPVTPKGSDPADAPPTAPPSRRRTSEQGTSREPTKDSTTKDATSTETNS